MRGSFLHVKRSVNRRSSIRMNRFLGTVDRLKSCSGWKCCEHYSHSKNSTYICMGVYADTKIKYGENTK